MPEVTVLSEYCKSCGLCVSICPKKILTVGSKANAKGYYYVAVTAADQCIGCGLCRTMCPDVAIELRK